MCEIGGRDRDEAAEEIMVGLAPRAVLGMISRGVRRHTIGGAAEAAGRDSPPGAIS